MVVVAFNMASATANYHGNQKVICLKNVKVRKVDNTGQHTKIFAEDISTILGYIRCADSENSLIFAELALVFEINTFFMKILLT